MSKNSGFTIIEIIIVIAIIGILLGSVLTGYNTVRESAQISKVIYFKEDLRKALVAYKEDMGFYPPEVSKGWDPGFEKSLPWNPDENPPSANIDCDHCPANWQDIVADNWNGPYIGRWESLNPWGGKYDYNYFDANQTIGGCSVPAGIYLGVVSDYSGLNSITSSIEDKMIKKEVEYEKCINSQSQILIGSL